MDKKTEARRAITALGYTASKWPSGNSHRGGLPPRQAPHWAILWRQSRPPTAGLFFSMAFIAIWLCVYLPVDYWLIICPTHTGTHSRTEAGKLRWCAKPGPPAVFVNKVLLEHSHLMHLHIYGCSGTSTAQMSMQHRSYGSQSQIYLLSGPKWEEFEDSHSKILALCEQFCMLCPLLHPRLVGQSLEHNRCSVHLFSK